jgi:hypothetical protein
VRPHRRSRHDQTRLSHQHILFTQVGTPIQEDLLTMSMAPLEPRCQHARLLRLADSRTTCCMQLQLQLLLLTQKR